MPLWDSQNFNEVTNNMKIIDTLIKNYPVLKDCENDIKSACQLIIDCYKNNKKVLVCGNGGSAADSEHIVGELMKGFNLKRPLSADLKDKLEKYENGKHIADTLQSPLRAISLVSHTGLMTAFANDCDADLVFAQQVLGFGDEGDVLISLSTSGNSKNVVYATETAKALGLKVVSITGGKESKLSALSDITIKTPKFTPFEVQELTLPIYHGLCAQTEAEFFTE